MKKPTFISRIMTYFFIAFFVMSLIVTITLYLFVSPKIFENDELNRINKLQSIGLNIENYLKIKSMEVEKICESIAALNSEISIKEYIDSQIKTQNDFDGMYIFNNNGFSYGNIDIKNKEIFSNQNNAKTSILVEEISNRNDIYIYTQLEINGAKGIFAGKLKQNEINSILGISEMQSAVIKHNNLKSIASSNAFALNMDKLSWINSIYQLSNQQIVKFNDIDEIEKVAVIQEVKILDSIIVGILSKKEFYHNSYQIIYSTALSIVLVSGIAFFIITLVWTILLRSINKFINGVHAVENGDLNYRINSSSRDIIKEVSDGFDNMVKKLGDNYEKMQKQTEELYERNWQIEESNRQIEDSYIKLQETINQLNDAEEKYYSLVKNIPEIVCVFDNDGIITFVNDVVFDILGYHKSEMIGKNINVLISPELNRKFLTILTKRLNKKNKIIFEMPMVRKDGRYIIAEAKLTYYLRNGSIDGIQAIVRDITKSKKMQKEILHKNEELLTIYNISKSLSSTIELDNVFELIVNEVCKILNAEMCVLRLLDISGNNLILKAYSGTFFNGVSDDDLIQFSIMNINSSGIDLRQSPNVAFIDEFEKSWIVSHINSKKDISDRLTQLVLVPICSKEKVLGLIAVGTKYRISEKHVNILTSIANNAAVAIENATLYENSKKYFIKTIDALIAAVEAKDKYTEGHSRRVSKYVDIIGTALDLPKEKIEDLKIAGILHDVGKIGISDSILLKPGKLTKEEYEEVKQHPIISNRILYSVGLSETTMKAIACHHERYDGTGYPFGLKGEELSIECQIIGVADAFDAMTSNRAYRQALTIEDAINEIVRNKGTQFGPVVVDAMVDLYINDISKITTALNDNEIAG